MSVRYGRQGQGCFRSSGYFLLERDWYVSLMEATDGGENMCVNYYHPKLKPFQSFAYIAGRACGLIQNKIKKDMAKGLEIDDSEFQNWSCLARCPPGFLCSYHGLKRYGPPDYTKITAKQVDES